MKVGVLVLATTLLAGAGTLLVSNDAFVAVLAAVLRLGGLL